MSGIDTLAKSYADGEYAVFSMPGHKNRAPFVLPDKAYLYDFTESCVTDDLYSLTGEIARSEERAAALYGSGFCCYTASGASHCVMTAFGLIREASESVLISRFCHTSAVSGMSIFGVRPVWLSQKREGTVYLPVTASEIDEALSASPEVKAVFLTSPDYYGMMSDIAEVSAVCRRHGALLAIDNAHGSHLAAVGAHPAEIADIVCDSLHKTLPALTGCALLHIGQNASKRFSKRLVKGLMSRLATTSPSYLLLASACRCVEWTFSEGSSSYANCYIRAAELRNKITEAGFLVSPAEADAVRLTVSALPFGIDGEELGRKIASNGVVPEMCDDRSAVFIITPFNNADDFERLYKSLLKIRSGKVRTEICLPSESIRIPTVAFPPRFPEGLMKEEVSVNEAVGRIAAENFAVYPPSRPVILTGEYIDEAAVSELKKAGKTMLRVVV